MQDRRPARALVSQPQVIGELLVGLALGPTILGAAAPGVERLLFPPSVLPPLQWAANAGLALYVFLIATEVDLPTLGGLARRTAAFALATAGAGFAAGAVAAAACGALAPVGVHLGALALFLGAAFAITAVPVLVRILDDHPFVPGSLATLALAVAVAGNVVAWGAIAAATVVARGGDGAALALRLALTLVAGGLAFALLRRLLARLATPRHRGVAAALTVAAALALALASQEAGLTVVVGALVAGAAVPRGTRLAAAANVPLRRLGTPLLLPLTFAYTGLHTRLSVFDGAHAGRLVLAVVAAPVAVRLLSVVGTAAMLRYSACDALTLGALLNARGVTELVILNAGLAEGILSVPLFTALVVMAVTTTLLAGPLLAAAERLRRRAPRGAALPVPTRTRMER